MSATNVFITWSQPTNVWIIGASSFATNLIEYRTDKAETKVVTITNYVTVAAPAPPMPPIRIPVTTVVGIFFSLLCVWRLWWLRKADRKLKQAREEAYDYYLSIKNPPHSKSLYL